MWVPTTMLLVTLAFGVYVALIKFEFQQDIRKLSNELLDKEKRIKKMESRLTSVEHKHKNLNAIVKHKQEEMPVATN